MPRGIWLRGSRSSRECIVWSPKSAHTVLTILPCPSRGYQFTQKLEGMFNDMRLSTEMMNGYQRAKHNKDEVSMIRSCTMSLVAHTARFIGLCSRPERHRPDLYLLAGRGDRDHMRIPTRLDR